MKIAKKERVKVILDKCLTKEEIEFLFENVPDDQIIVTTIDEIKDIKKMERKLLLSEIKHLLELKEKDLKKEQ